MSDKPILHPRKYARDADEIGKAFADAGLENVVLLDGEYAVLPEDEMLACATATHTSLQKYRKDYFDCDKFARLFWARFPLLFGVNSTGIFLNYAGRHAFNMALVQTGKGGLAVRIVEPQSDAEVSLGSSAPYKIVKGRYLVVV